MCDSIMFCLPDSLSKSVDYLSEASPSKRSVPNDRTNPRIAGGSLHTRQCVCCTPPLHPYVCMVVATMRMSGSRGVPREKAAHVNTSNCPHLSCTRWVRCLCFSRKRSHRERIVRSKKLALAIFLEIRRRFVSMSSRSPGDIHRVSRSPCKTTVGECAQPAQRQRLPSGVSRNQVTTDEAVSPPRWHALGRETKTPDVVFDTVWVRASNTRSSLVRT